MNIWSSILSWFKERSERNDFLNQFNESAKMAFISGQTDTFLKASVSMGNSSYRHAFSKFLAGGFRIKALSGRALTKAELIEVGRVILDNEELVRKLISLGWDTLEVHDDKGFNGVKWALKDFANIGGFIQ